MSDTEMEAQAIADSLALDRFMEKLFQPVRALSPRIGPFIWEAK